MHAGDAIYNNQKEMTVSFGEGVFSNSCISIGFFLEACRFSGIIIL